MRVILCSILGIGAGIAIQYAYDRDDSFHLDGFFLMVLGIIGLIAGIMMASNSYADFQRCNGQYQFATKIEIWAAFASVFIFATIYFGLRALRQVEHGSGGLSPATIRIHSGSL